MAMFAFESINVLILKLVIFMALAVRPLLNVLTKHLRTRVATTRASRPAMDQVYREEYERRVNEKQGFTQGYTPRSSYTPRSTYRPSRYPVSASQASENFIQNSINVVGSYFWTLTCITVVGFTAYFLLATLWRVLVPRIVDWIAALPQHASVQATVQYVQHLPQALRERAYGAWVQFRYNWFWDQLAFRWHQLHNKIRVYFLRVVVALFVAWAIWSLWPKRPDVIEIPLEDASAYGFDVPDWVKQTAERQERGLTNYIGPDHHDEVGILGADPVWRDPSPPRKRVPFPDAAEPELSSAETVVVTVYEPTTITVYEKPEPASTTTRWGTVVHSTTITVHEQIDHTITIPGTTLISTVHDPSTVTVTESVVVEGAVGMGPLSPVNESHETHDHVRREVEGDVWCKACRQFHSGELPY